MIIGVTGTDGSGKDTVGQLLVEKLGWPHYSLSDEIRQIATERGLDLSRETLANLANELRQAHGPSYLAQRIAERAAGDFVVTSVRNPLECEPFRATGKFVLIAVDAPLHIRYARTSGSRDRAGESRWTIEDLRHHEETVEMSGGEFGQQLKKMLELADIKIINDGTIEELQDKAGKIVAEAKMYKRYTWDEYFMAICDTVGGRGTCDRGRSGAVIVRDKRIVSTGYVGSPMGLQHCDEVGHEFKDTIHEDGHISKHCVRTTHAEQNAICQAARFGATIDGGTLYCKMTPCYTCAKMIINAGIRRVVAQKDYHAGADTRRVFLGAGIQFDILDDTLEVYADQVPARTTDAVQSGGGTTPAAV